MTIKNISPLILKFSIKTSFAFYVDKSEYSLNPDESATVNVIFDPTYRKDKISHNVKTKLFIIYKEHPQKDSIELTGVINFPNLEFQNTTVDFGATLNEFEAIKKVIVSNNSKVAAAYQWVFEQDFDYDDKLEINQVFDILPIRGYLQPGDMEEIQFIYCGAPNKSFTSVAVCQVEGGPDYRITLKGESSTIQYKFDKTSIECGIIGYDYIDEKEFTLFNTGKVTFNFNIDLGDDNRRNCLEVIPMKGSLKGGEKQRFIVRYLPGIPDFVQDTFQVQVAHFEPQTITISAIVVYPMVSLSLNRAESRIFSGYIERAKEVIEKKATYLDLVLSSIPEKEYKIPSVKPSLVQIITEAERLMFKEYLHQNVSIV